MPGNMWTASVTATTSLKRSMPSPHAYRHVVKPADGTEFATPAVMLAFSASGLISSFDSSVHGVDSCADARAVTPPGQDGPATVSANPTASAAANWCLFMFVSLTSDGGPAIANGMPQPRRETCANSLGFFEPAPALAHAMPCRSSDLTEGPRNV